MYRMSDNSSPSRSASKVTVLFGSSAIAAFRSNKPTVCVICGSASLGTGLAKSEISVIDGA